MKAQIEKDESLHIYAETYAECMAFKYLRQLSEKKSSSRIFIHYIEEEEKKAAT